jgi:hypothetical protein
MTLTRNPDNDGWHADLTDEEVRLLDLAVCMLEPDQVSSPDQRNTLAAAGTALMEACGALGGLCP